MIDGIEECRCCCSVADIAKFGIENAPSWLLDSCSPDDLIGVHDSPPLLSSCS